MRLTLTAIIGINPRCEFGGTSQAVRFRSRTLPMDPLRFNRVAPRTVAGHVADDEAPARRTALDPRIVRASPGPHGLAAVPRGVLPEQPPCGEALGGALGRAPGQPIARDGTHRTPGHTPEPPRLSRRRRLRPPPQAIPGERLGIGIGWRGGQLLELVRGFCRRPARLGRLGQPTPPACVAPPQAPRRLGPGPREQWVAPLFFRADAGAGLGSQGVARVQATRKRRRATRLVSSLPRRGVRPWAPRTAAASASGHRLVGVSNVRGLWCHRARRDSQAPASKRGAMVCGREERGWSTARPRGCNACMAWRTV